MENIKFVTNKSSRIDKLIDTLYKEMPRIECARGVLVTESYKATENLPIIKRRSAAFSHILNNIPIVIREGELIVGSATVAPRGCQVFPEYSYEWLEAELDTVHARAADPFFVSEEVKATLRRIYPYWKGKTCSDLARANMSDAAYEAFAEHAVFTPGNYFYNGIGHVCVDYPKVLRAGYRGIISDQHPRRLNPNRNRMKKPPELRNALCRKCRRSLSVMHLFRGNKYRLCRRL